MNISFSTEAAEFIVGYYQTLVYNPKNLALFYAPYGVVLRPGMAIQEYAHNCPNLGLNLDASSTLVVKNYKIVPYPGLIIVNGVLRSSAGEKRFVQTFVMGNSGLKIAIQSDVLMFEEESKTFVVPRP